MLPIVAIVGRPNVGKSTLFNRILRKNRAITHDRPGVTRDRLYGRASWDEATFDLVDTGGMVFGEQESLVESIFDQAREAVEESALVLMVVDGREGPTPLDQSLAAYLRQFNKPVLLVVNKVDGPEQEPLLTADFYGFGFPIVGVSAAHGHNIGGLVEEIASRLPEQGEEIIPQEESELRLALIGRPNVGKSSMINALLGENRLIVSPEAGTTRDSVDVMIKKGEKRYTFLDTAGMRRRTKITDTLERFSVLRSLKSSKRANVTILVLDALEGLVSQDKKLLSFLDKEKAAFMVAVNKVDLVPRQKMEEFKKDISEELRIMPHVPVAYTSALSKAGLGGLLPLAEKIWAQCQIRVGTGKLNRTLQEATARHQPPVVKKRRAKFYYMTQPEVAPPTFILFVNDPELIKPSYVRFLENQLRKGFGLTMAPLQLYFRSSHDKKE
jgi:GTPase